MTKDQPLTLLGGITPTQFLNEYWQKKPLLIKQAIPHFPGLLSPEKLAGLACEEDVQARIVEQIHGEWRCQHGPFSEADFAKLPDTPSAQHRWTLLVQSVNHYLPEANQLLQQFDFIPHARLDDLMVSYAPDGGGVGPHFDSYDVFLLQGQGQRLWRISEQSDLSLQEGAPLRILKNFTTAQEWLLEAGDMLYLPPHLAHWGIAVSHHTDGCMTYSIGFRAPKQQELSSEFLGFMQEKILQDEFFPTTIYQDADLTLQQHPAEISTAMIQKISQFLQKIQWSDQDVAEFIGSYLSEPKIGVVFDPHKKLSQRTFKEKLSRQGVALDLKSKMLFSASHFFINGEKVTATGITANFLKILADHRQLTPVDLKNNPPPSEELLQQLSLWHQAGYLNFNPR